MHGHNPDAGDTPGNPGHIALIDCENLTSDTQRAAASRWSGFGRVELFGRVALVTPWRLALAAADIAVTAETFVADDAPSQAADQAMAWRVDALIRTGTAALVVIASNDKGFDADIARLAAAGIAAGRHRDLTVPETLALVVREQAGDDWAAAGGIGDHLRRRFGIRLRGRVEALARAAGLETRHGPAGLMLRVNTAPR
ncbi:MAG: hypothetical protein EPN20_13275 [Magnetospirillum sp.]|nr:MAG: hypothetical protein EPN20_13275 [Magnetospirillum sp.]